MLLLHYKALPTAPTNRREARAAQSAAAQELLEELLQHCNVSGVVAKTDKGRPYLKDVPTVDFSLAHTDGFAICALQKTTRGIAPRVGVDAERPPDWSKAKLKDFALRFFGPHERSYVLNAADIAAAFTKIFVRKEAFAKYRGNGLGANLTATDTLSPDFEKNENVRFFFYREGDIFISLCLAANCCEQPVLHKKTENES